MPSFFFHLKFDLDFRIAPEEFHRKGSVDDSPDPESLTEDTAAKHQKTSSLGNQEAAVPNPSAPKHLARDWRYDKIYTRTLAMTSSVASADTASGSITNGISVGPAGLATKGKYDALDSSDEEGGWGIIRLYRDAEETPGLYDETVQKPSKLSRNAPKEPNPSFRDEDCTTLCILAVPSYLTPSDFLGFVGEKTRDEVSHFRMIRTERSNRFMVLIKFRNGKKAREWRKAWNGKSFDGMEPEYCHVVFVKSIEFRTPDLPGQESSFPDMSNDPFTPSVTKATNAAPSTSTLQSSASRSTKPMAPPTPALIELPTCPVCLERMDESTGLLTILCQHVFHCSCLQKWRGSGCPVCRYTQDDMHTLKHRHKPYTSDGEPFSNECSICHSEENLWICLICGTVGCGRYDAAHAFAHYEESSHCFAMDMTTQRVWDYASDGYVHRILQNQKDGKFVELTPTTGSPDPSTTPRDAHDPHAYDNDDPSSDYVPRSKLTNISLEYTALLTSQLDSQRTYYSSLLSQATDKATSAAASASQSLATITSLTTQLANLQATHSEFLSSTIPELERDRDREKRKAERYIEMARKLEREWRDEKAMSGSLVERVEGLSKQVEVMGEGKKELEEQVRDLSFFIAGGEKLKALENEEGDVAGGTVSLPERKEEESTGGDAGKGKKTKKKKGKK